jgi:hypothetical protein
MSLRNVIYYNDGTYPLRDLVNLPYTDVIIGFLVPGPDGTTLAGGGGAFKPDLYSNVQALQNAGKNVLISIGGATFPSSAWQNYARNVQGLVNQIWTNFVGLYNFNGVDIDYEDDSGFGENPTYDGVKFLSDLTSALYQKLAPSGRAIITHAPSTPFWDSASDLATNGVAPYTQIWRNVGNQIAWINNQFYDNQTYDQTAALKVHWYQQIAAITGPQKLLAGMLVGDPALYKGPPPDTDEGYIQYADVISSVIKPLKAQYGSNFGGVTGWEFSQDGPPTYPSPQWGYAIGTSLSDLFVFYQGANNDGQLWYSVWDELTTGELAPWPQFHPPISLNMSGSPAAVRWKDGITVFHHGSNNNGQLWYTYSSDGVNWGGDTQVQGVGITGSPSAVVYDGKLYVFYQGQGNDGQLWFSTYDGVTWQQYMALNPGMSGSPCAVLWAGGITVFYQGPNNNGQLYYTFSPDGKNWGGTTLVPVLAMTGSPSAAVADGLLWVFHQGGGNDGQLRVTTTPDGIHWSGDLPAPNVIMSGSPSAVLYWNNIMVFHQAANNDGQLWFAFIQQTIHGPLWNPDHWVQGPIMSGSPSCVVF